jgi:lysozyme
MRVSDKGKEFVKRNEGLRLNAYKDSGGKLTLGWGHLVVDSDDVGLTISLGKAQELFDADVTDIEDDVNKAVTADLLQHQFDALCDFTFNCGGRNLRRSTLLKLVNSGHVAGVPAQFGRWVYAGDQNGDGVVDESDKIAGLLARRKREAKLFMDGDYGF